MSEKVNKIAVLTSGGDAPGMNAAIRAVVRSAILSKIEVCGVIRGYNGLINDEIVKMDSNSVSGIIQRGGTALYTARCKEFETLEGQKKARDICKKHNIDALVVIGGDGSFKGAQAISRLSIPCICIPGTIDNDIASTSYTIGYDTAMNTAMEMVDKLRDTAQSHDRCTVVEVMGRHAGYLALNVGISCGATSILIPEVQFDFQKDIVEEIIIGKNSGKKHFIIIVAEGVKGKDTLAQRIEDGTGIETRLTVLGHVQRGGAPTARDRIVASIMGEHAVQLLKNNKINRVVSVQNDDVTDYGFEEAFSMKKKLDTRLYKVAHDISI